MKLHVNCLTHGAMNLVAHDDGYRFEPHADHLGHILRGSGNSFDWDQINCPVDARDHTIMLRFFVDEDEGELLFEYTREISVW